ncbi:Adhesion G-protein coupled receptor G2 [Portunus trituberculatus]|uniref:Adhesion G-protein coupled receptor G2 n=1 Tax=Portunus trituberculatus TaxID=210409 RepID=A0A5B7EXM6_PORTR|nr:Adhesion G-protein coupled receptor G2 [Portunus trituberculatus]
MFFSRLRQDVYQHPLHYLVVAAFAWMLVEAANMYQLLITVFASAETHFMAKRVVTAWGIPVVLVVIALAIDKDMYGDPAHGHCVINPMSNPAVYYSTYLDPSDTC